MRNNNNSMMATLAAELKTIISATISKEINFVTTEVKQITAAIEQSQEFLSTKFDEIMTDLMNLKAENENLKAEIECLKKSQSHLQGTVRNLEANADKSEKAALCSNAVVWGIPTVSNENVYQVVGKIFRCLGLGDKLDRVLSVERMFTNNPSSKALVPIRVVFCNKESKEEVLNKKKHFGKLLSTAIDEKFTVNGRPLNVTLRDELTPLSLEILKELRASQEQLNVKYVWAGRGGIVLAKKDSNSKPEAVRNRNDLSRVMSLFLKTAHALDPTDAEGQYPSPKRQNTY